MGCDIHAYGEIKINNMWHFVSEIEIFRNYSLFALLANVRNYDDIKAISDPKGLPVDTSEVVKYYYSLWDGDAHSESYLTEKEYLHFKEKINNAFKEYGHINNFDSFFSEDFLKHEKRVIFWFDN